LPPYSFGEASYAKRLQELASHSHSVQNICFTKGDRFCHSFVYHNQSTWKNFDSLVENTSLFVENTSPFIENTSLFVYLVSGVVLKYSKDSQEYEMTDGVRKSDACGGH
jgi:hypothetical protein